jgi:hypothetical protein
MTLTNIKSQVVTLTENEAAVANYIQQQLNDGITSIYGEDVEYGCGLDNKIARGVLSSMVKKGLIYVDKKEGGLISKFWEN